MIRTNIRIYSYQKIDMNECPNRYSYRKYSNIRLFEYIRHTLIQNTSTITHANPNTIASTIKNTKQPYKRTDDEG